MLERLSMLSRGLILVTGAAGSGKSTTLAAMLDYRNTNAGGHILCIEDPIEFLHSHKQSIVNQREVGLDTHSFSAALHNALREAPDVIMIGEIRDADTMQHALHYAETGHLCVATLHATSTTHTLERIARFFPEDARRQVLADVAQNLVAIVGQRLIPGTQQKRVAAIELMLGTPGTNTMESYVFEFSVENEAVADSLMRCSGKNVELHYKEYLGALPWRGQQKYVVDKILSVN